MKATFAGLFLIFTVGLMSARPQSGLSDQLLGRYYGIQKSLASDSIAGVSAAAAKIADLSRRAVTNEPQAKTQLKALAVAADKLRTNDLRSARSGFGELTDRMIAYLQAIHARANPPYEFYCPMVKKNWLQADKDVRNPYYGNSMLKCGEPVQPGLSVEKNTGHNKN
jgi:hypothetical protein